ncbi:MAG TPA: hypothetical protein VMT32_04045 [Bryobacteraceae bacterium]|nr:hypothetical protein [Bryobacteraceae bacterium]
MKTHSRYLLAGAVLVASALPAGAGERPQILFSRLAPERSGLFIADGDGNNERPLLPATGLDYNASYSYDGKWIVFTSERAGSADIYRMHADGSGIEQLTSGPSYDDQAALSPDDKTLAFVSTRDAGTANVWLLDIARHEYTNLTKNPGGNFRPSWSPDGNWIAFSSGRDTHPGRAEPSWELLQSTAIYIVHPDGTGLRRLTELGGYAGSPQWSHDGRRIVFHQTAPKDVYPGRFEKTATSQIWSIDVETGATQTHTSGQGLKVSPRYTNGDEIGYVLAHQEKRGLRFTSGRSGPVDEIRHPSWSPDGQTVLYQKNFRDAVDVRPAFGIDGRVELLSTRGDMPAYSPNGDQVVLTPNVGKPMVIMNADGTNMHQVLDNNGKVITFPLWSPDGKSIVFGIGGFFDRPVTPGQLGIIRPDGSGLRILTEGKFSSGFASWAPDGKQIVYRVMGDGHQGLRIMNIDDGKITTLTTDYDTFPMWSPRGDLIVFCSFRDGDFDLFTIRPDGTDVKKLTNSHGNDAHPAWSPDGNWILFSSSRKGFKDEALVDEWGPQPYGDLYMMHTDGTDLRQLTDNQFEEATPAWKPERLNATSASR